MKRFRETATKRIIGIIGLMLAIVVLGANLLLSKEFLTAHSEIYPMAVASTTILSSVLLAESLDVAPAVFEVLLGFVVGLSGIETSRTLEALAIMGSASLMFFAGLEMDLEMLSKNFKRSFIIGGLSFLVPLVSTISFLMLLGYSLKVSLMIATGVSTTSVAVVYSIFRKLGFIKNATGQSLLAATMIADILSIVTFSALVMKLSYSLLIYITSLVVVPPLLGRVLNRMPELAHEAEVKTIMAILLAAILFSESIGIHAVLFSFILGLAFSDASGIREEAMKKLEGIIFGFLAPMFFTAAGMELGKASPLSYLKATIILLAVSYPAKLLISYISLKRFCRASVHNLLQLSNVFAARLTMSTIIAYAGLKSGLLPPDVSGGIMLSAIIATVIAGFVAGKSILIEEEL